MSSARPVLHVCTTCRGGDSGLDDAPRAGALLHAAVAAMNVAIGGPLELRPVSCLAACDRGCTAAISMAGKFSYLLGGMSPETAEDVFDYALRYAASPQGLVLPSLRGASSRHTVLGRFPGTELDMPDR